MLKIPPPLIVLSFSNIHLFFIYKIRFDSDTIPTPNINFYTFCWNTYFYKSSSAIHKIKNYYKSYQVRGN